jgi:hypothetical protein
LAQLSQDDPRHESGDEETCPGTFGDRRQHEQDQERQAELQGPAAFARPSEHFANRPTHCLVPDGSLRQPEDGSAGRNF